MTQKWKWRAISLWIIVFTSAVLYLSLTNRRNIHDIRETQRNLASLQLSSCLLNKALINSAHKQQAQAKKIKDPKEKTRLNTSAKQIIAFANLIYKPDKKVKC